MGLPPARLGRYITAQFSAGTGRPLLYASPFPLPCPHRATTLGVS